MSHALTSQHIHHPLPTTTFKSYLLILIAIGTIILVASYIHLRPYLSSLSINYLTPTSSSARLSISPSITEITDGSATFSWSTTPPNLTYLDYGMTEQTLDSQIALPPSSTYTLNGLVPGRRYFFRLRNAEYSFITATYSFITKQK